MIKVHLKALGCRLNEAELEQWSQHFLADGCQISRDASDADLLVLNTCAVTHEASRKSRYLISRLHRDNPTAKLVVTGCHASLNPEQVADNLGVDLVVRNDQKSRLANIARQELALPTMPLSATNPEDIALYSRGRHRAFIKVQDGCRYRCTFCIVTMARGEEQSRSLEEITAEIRRFHRHGILEVVLTGVHVGGYGSDTGSSLAELIQAILNDTDIPRLRLASVEPWDLPDNFCTLFDNARLMPHMHLPLQSGSDSVLRRMARRCKSTQFTELVDMARDARPEFNITTDIIAGFPGETGAEWAETLAFVESTGFGHIHIFPYSPRQGTKAAGLPDQIDAETRKYRCKQLSGLADRMKLAALRHSVDTTQAVLWERPAESGQPEMTVWSGYTPNYHRVELHTRESLNLEYRIAPVRLTGVDGTRQVLAGELQTAQYMP